MDKRYATRLKADLVEQFKGKPRIEALLEVIGSELQELHDFFAQLMIERDIKIAVGKQLDGIGSIADLTRNEALALARESQYSYDDEDEMYRAFLYYKIFVNSAIGTYSDILRSIHMLWDGKLTYEERVDIPATIILNFERFTEHDVNRLLNIPIIKPAGVQILFRSHGYGENNLYVGGNLLQMRKVSFIQTEEPVLPNCLCDEDGNLLLDENGLLLYEE